MRHCPKPLPATPAPAAESESRDAAEEQRKGRGQRNGRDLYRSEDEGRISEGGVQTWELWRRGQAVGVVTWDPWSDRVALIEQFRLPALAGGFDPVVLECPAGLLEEGEEPEPAARRELLEETGLVADRMLPMGRYILSQGGSDEGVRLYLGRTRLPVLFG